MNISVRIAVKAIIASHHRLDAWVLISEYSPFIYIYIYIWQNDHLNGHLKFSFFSPRDGVSIKTFVWLKTFTVLPPGASPLNQWDDGLMFRKVKSFILHQWAHTTQNRRWWDDRVFVTHLPRGASFVCRFEASTMGTKVMFCGGTRMRYVIIMF